MSDNQNNIFFHVHAPVPDTIYNKRFWFFSALFHAFRHSAERCSVGRLLGDGGDAMCGRSELSNQTNAAQNNTNKKSTHVEHGGSSICFRNYTIQSVTFRHGIKVLMKLGSGFTTTVHIHLPARWSRGCTGRTPCRQQCNAPPLFVHYWEVAAPDTNPNLLLMTESQHTSVDSNHSSAQTVYKSSFQITELNPHLFQKS